MGDRPLISWLIATALEGVAAGIVSGLVLLLFHADMQALLATQPEPTLALSVFLMACAQIGVLVSISVTMTVDWTS